MKSIFCVIALLTAFVPLTATAVVTTQLLPAGPNPVHAAVDTVTGRVFVANVGSGRYGSGMSYTVIEPDGRSTSFPDDKTPVHVAVSAALRKVVITNGAFAGESVTILDADTLQKTRVATGFGPVKSIIVDATATAYLAGRSFHGTKGPGSMTEVDLRAGTSRIIDVPGYSPDQFTVAPALGKVFLAGNGVPGGIALASTAWIQAYDMNTHALLGTPTRIPGRQVEAIFAAPDASRLYVIAHVDAMEMRDRPVPSLRAAVFVIDPATLQVVATHLLPDMARQLVIPFAEVIDLFGPEFNGTALLEPETNRLYLLEHYNKRLSRLDLATGALSTIPLEAVTHALAYNSATRTLHVSFIDGGYLGTFNGDLERLDTIPLGVPTPRRESIGMYALATNPATGVIYATYPKESALVKVSAPQAADAQKVVNLTDLWSNPQEPGWGLFLDHQGLTLFGTLFTSDANGDGTWLVMPESRRQSDGAFIGLLYRTTGPASQAVASAAAVGAMRFSVDANGLGALQYTVGSTSVSKAVERQVFAAAARRCAWTATSVEGEGPGTNFTALWYNPAAPGWGLTLSQQGDTMFGVLYDYDTQDRAAWSVMSNGQRLADGSYAGELHRMAGGQLQSVGSLSVQFASARAGTMHTVVGGVNQSRPIARQVFSAPTTACSN